MSEVAVVFEKIGDAIDGHRSTAIMAALTATTAAILLEMKQDGVTLDEALAVFNKQVREHFARALS